VSPENTSPVNQMVTVVRVVTWKCEGPTLTPAVMAIVQKIDIHLRSVETKNAVGR